ncbi:hypothetical protein DSO57_1008158, partial [Entomophthora muscae]
MTRLISSTHSADQPIGVILPFLLPNDIINIPRSLGVDDTFIDFVIPGSHTGRIHPTITEQASQFQKDSKRKKYTGSCPTSSRSKVPRLTHVTVMQSIWIAQKPAGMINSQQHQTSIYPYCPTAMFDKHFPFAHQGMPNLVPIHKVSWLPLLAMLVHLPASIEQSNSIKSHHPNK